MAESGNLQDSARIPSIGGSINQSLNLITSLRGIEFALSIRARGSCVKRMTKAKKDKINK